LSFLKLFTALITINGIREVFVSALLAESGFRFFFDPMPATGTEFGIRSQVFLTVQAFRENQLLMAAMGAKFGFRR